MSYIFAVMLCYLFLISYLLQCLLSQCVSVVSAVLIADESFDLITRIDGTPSIIGTAGHLLLESISSAYNLSSLLGAESLIFCVFPTIFS